MSRAGRRRNHQLKRKGIAIVSTVETIPTPNQVARRMPHRRLVDATHAHDERAETPLGVMYVVGAIPRRLYVAGIRFARAYRSYCAAISAPRIAESIAGVGQPGRSRGDEITREQFERAQAEYFGAEDALKEAGRNTAAVTRHVIVDDAGIPPGGYRALLEGLGALAAHFKKGVENNSAG